MFNIMPISLRLKTHIQRYLNASIWGIFLFVVFIQDLSNVIYVEFQRFADDLRLYFPLKLQNNFIKLQNNINAWL